MITVIEVCRAMRVDLPPHLAWSVGARVRNIYADRYGHLPPKDNRPKTSGNGTHCFALYPEDMRPEIETVIRSVGAEESRQGSLF